MLSEKSGEAKCLEPIKRQTRDKESSIWPPDIQAAETPFYTRRRAGIALLEQEKEHKTQASWITFGQMFLSIAAQAHCVP